MKVQTLPQSALSRPCIGPEVFSAPEDARQNDKAADSCREAGLSTAEAAGSFGPTSRYGAVPYCGQVRCHAENIIFYFPIKM